MDLRETTPADDLLEILSRPAQFFASFREDYEIDFWMMIKSLGGAAVATALLSWSSLPASMASTVSSLQGLMGLFSGAMAHEFAMIPSEAMDGAAILGGLPFIIGATIFKALLWPILELFAIVLLSFGVMMMLPLLGVSQKKASFYRILVVFGYCHWLSLLYLLPGLGGVLGTIAMILVPILAIKHVFEISVLRAYAAFLFFPLVILSGFVFASFFFWGLGIQA